MGIEQELRQFAQARRQLPLSLSLSRRRSSVPVPVPVPGPVPACFSWAGGPWSMCVCVCCVCVVRSRRVTTHTVSSSPSLPLLLLLAGDCACVSRSCQSRFLITPSPSLLFPLLPLLLSTHTYRDTPIPPNYFTIALIPIRIIPQRYPISDIVICTLHPASSPLRTATATIQVLESKSALDEIGSGRQRLSQRLEDRH
jgi:hypothetical protein